ncbi:MAG TPA: transposase [Candidatus Sulfopaludibacter sp.]|nr:transposase [Candidatus Sulfopaludibacter sp.]
MSYTRRHLPHWVPEDADVFVTWRLAGTSPKTPGPAVLTDNRIAKIVSEALLFGESTRRAYRLHAWVIMPNHVHAVLRPHSPLPATMQWLKTATARRANRILKRVGIPFWQEESFDHWIRKTEHLEDLILYVENNPVRAGLVESADLWPWSSAKAGNRVEKPPPEGISGFGWEGLLLYSISEFA